MSLLLYYYLLFTVVQVRNVDIYLQSDSNIIITFMVSVLLLLSILVVLINSHQIRPYQQIVNSFLKCLSITHQLTAQRLLCT